MTKEGTELPKRASRIEGGKWTGKKIKIKKGEYHGKVCYHCSHGEKHVSISCMFTPKWAQCKSQGTV